MIKYLYVEEYSDYVFYTKSQITDILAEHNCITAKAKDRWLFNNGFRKYNIGDRLQDACKKYPFIGKIFGQTSDKIRYFSDILRDELPNVDVIFDHICISEHYIDRIIFNVQKQNDLYTCKLQVNYNNTYTDEEDVNIEHVSGSLSGCMFACLVEFMNSTHHSKVIVWDTITKNV